MHYQSADYFHGDQAVHQPVFGQINVTHAGMIHRDIKPQNLMLSTDGKLKILDFGLASLAEQAFIEEAAGEVQVGSHDSALTTAGSMMGTPDYVAPEQTLDAATTRVRSVPNMR